MTVGYPSPALPVYNFALFPGMARELESAGSALTLDQYKGYTPMVSGLLSGEMDFGVLSLTSLLKARAQDFPVVAPVGYTREYGFAMVTAPEVDGWEDLRGRTVALHSPSSVSTVTGRVMVEEELGSRDAVDFQYIVGTPSRLAAIDSGDVAAAVVFVSGALAAEEEGRARALSFPWEYDRLRDQTTAALVVPEAAVEERPETVRAVVDAATATYEGLYGADPATVTERALESGHYSAFPSEVWEDAFEGVREAGMWPEGRGLTERAVSDAQDVLVGTGMIAEDQRLPREAVVADV
jgi:ABC-type nitrate/sulfonate/bicarbonate transport system substrate-binding protein